MDKLHTLPSLPRSHPLFILVSQHIVYRSSPLIILHEMKIYQWRGAGLTFWSSIIKAVFCSFILNKVHSVKQCILFIVSSSDERIWISSQIYNHHVMHNFAVIKLQISMLICQKTQVWIWERPLWKLLLSVLLASQSFIVNVLSICYLPGRFCFPLFLLRFT